MTKESEPGMTKESEPGMTKESEPGMTGKVSVMLNLIQHLIGKIAGQARNDGKGKRRFQSVRTQRSRIRRKNRCA